MSETLFTLEIRLTAAIVTKEFAAANPVVSRTIEIRGQHTLLQLNRAILGAFGHQGDRCLCEFHFDANTDVDDGPKYFVANGSAVSGMGEQGGTGREPRLSDLGLELGRTFTHWYAANWCHQVDVVAVGKPEVGRRYPRVIARLGENPKHPTFHETTEKRE